MITKSEQIKQSLNATRERRKSQTCKTYELKFDKSKMSFKKEHFFKMLFVEAKWLYNDILSTDDVFNYDDKAKVTHNLDKNKQPVEHKLTCLSSQMKQSLVNRTKDSIKALSKSKAKGNKAGKLKFKSSVSSIPLKQFGRTYRINDDKTISIQGLRKNFKVHGLSQIPADAEFANATLVKRYNDYYLYVTVYQKIEKRILSGEVGLDFGIKNSITTSDGDVYNYNFKETKSIKKAQKSLSRKKLGSQNRYKQKDIVAKRHGKLNNIKKDAKNKFVSKLKDKKLIAVQNEQLSKWHSDRKFSRKVQHDIMGVIISDLKKLSQTIIIDKFEPTTKKCFVCNEVADITLSDRIFHCQNCNFVMDRDVKSAIYILLKGIQISTGRRNIMPVEYESSVFNRSVKGKTRTLKQEATDFWKIYFQKESKKATNFWLTPEATCFS